MGLAAKNLKLTLPKDTSIDAQVALSKQLTLAVQFDIQSTHSYTQTQYSATLAAGTRC